MKRLGATIVKSVAAIAAKHFGFLEHTLHFTLTRASLRAMFAVKHIAATIV